VTKGEAVEKVGRAIVAKYGNPDQWQNMPKSKDRAEDIVAALVALGLLKVS